MATRIETESLDIHIPDVTRPHCRVTAGQARRMYYSSTQAVGMALLSQARESQGEEAGGRARAADFRWHDHLATHGIAIGQRSLQVATIAVIPATTRTVPAITARGTAPITLTFPPMLIGLLQKEGAFQRGVMYCVSPASLGALAITSPTPVCTFFPYGNVHTNGHICWGSIVHANIPNLAGLIELFFTSGFNGDLLAPAQIGQVEGRCSLTLMSTTAGGVVPLPTTFPQTIPQFIGNLI